MGVAQSPCVRNQQNTPHAVCIKDRQIIYLDIYTTLTGYGHVIAPSQTTQRIPKTE